jgi:hypothetical protein
MGQTLEVDLFRLQAEVGDYAGFGAGARFDDTAWNADQQRRIDLAVESGCRRVYFTEEMQDIPGSYPWSFLQPRVSLQIASGQSELPLPRDCDGLLGDVIPASTDGTAQWTVRVVSYDQVYKARSLSPDQTGRPTMCCEQVVKGTTLTQGSRYTLQVYPTTDAAYTLQLWISLSPGPLTAEHPVPYGGAPLAELFLSAVVAAYAEKWEKGRPETAEAVAAFQNRLRAAIAADRKHKPLYLGYNADHSDSPGYGRPLAHGSIWGIPLEVNGVSY